MDSGSSFMDGPSLAPPLVRAALHCPSTNLSTERGGDLEAFADDGRLVDVGDLVDIHGNDGLQCIRRRAEAIRAGGYRVVAIGGDHAVTLPLVQACADLAPHLTIVHLDAHPDLYDELDGNRYSHACPFARIMEAGGAFRLLQVGIRTCNAHQRQQARRWPVEMFPAGSRLDTDFPKVTWPVYLSVDLDVLDPAYAPGVSHHEPGGLTTREVISLIHTLQGTLIGADVVEYNPRQDLNGVTSRVAAKLVKEILGSMLIDG
jgi:agmatinase